VLGVSGGQLGARSLGGLAAVVSLVPLERADLREELLHRGLVVKQLSIEVSGVPVEQHTADVEHNGIDLISRKHDPPR
jgi:hypothetical protein